MQRNRLYHRGRIFRFRVVYTSVEDNRRNLFWILLSKELCNKRSLRPANKDRSHYSTFFEKIDNILHIFH